MKTFKLDSDFRFALSSTSRGNQIKWFSDNCYIKADTMGYESIAEVLSCELLLRIKSEFSFANYFLCNIVEDNTSNYNGCYSVNFLAEYESLVSVQRILEGYVPDLNRFFREYTGKDLLNKVLSILKDVTNLDCYDYIRHIIYLDAIILNEDRHFNNICLIYNSSNNSYRFSPIFDNGLSLLSDIRDYPRGASVPVLCSKVKSKPFSTDFKKQIRYFNSCLLILDYDDLIEGIKLCDSIMEDNRDYLRAKQVLIGNLKRWENILWIRA